MMKPLLLAFLLPVTSFAAGDAWLTDLEAAKAAASHAGKPMIIDFTDLDN